MIAVRDPLAFLASLGAQSVADDTMVDECVRLVYSSTTVNHRPVETWDDGDTYPCGFSWGSIGDTDRTQERQQIVSTAPRLRVPLLATFNSRDKVRITKRGGVALSPPLVFRVSGDPTRGITATMIELSQVTT